MFNIIVAIIAMVLVAALTVAGFYHMGGNVSEQKIEADAAKLRNEASQIAGAVKLYRGEGNEFGADFRLSTLVEMGYLKTLPADWEPGEDQIIHVLQDEEKAESVCFTANKQAGYLFDANDDSVIQYSHDSSFAIPLCNKSGLDPMVPCCSNG